MIADATTVLADDVTALLQRLEATALNLDHSADDEDRRHAITLRQASSVIQLLLSEVAVLREKVPDTRNCSQPSPRDGGGTPAPIGSESAGEVALSALADEVADIAHRVLARDCHEFAEGREHSPACSRASQEIIALVRRVRADAAKGLPPI